MPEGDSLARAARRLQVLVGERVEVETPHPRAAVKRLVERLDGRRLLGVEAAGKNLLLRFEDGVVLRSHLRMSGRWQVRARGSKLVGRPWLVLRGSEREAVLWNGPVLELDDRAVRRLGPDILAQPPDLDAMVANLRSDPQRAIGDALVDQRLIAGIGNLGKAEALWEARLSPSRAVAEVPDEDAAAAYASSRAGGCCTRTPPCAARPSWPHVRCFRASEPPVPSPLRWPEADADHRSPLPPSRPSRNFSAT